ncbi:FecCD family ABC transporter permease [Streptomyces tsukubensis]|uniref:FecCD family ABC transporter permease n=1 Tax=Streptomyces tsukubensis TaxID=83656 RepID=UPI00098EB215|nr:iron chelate uptake ABC transporter family permease subunit [Streptomyces tsukubensis]
MPGPHSAPPDGDRPDGTTSVGAGSAESGGPDGPLAPSSGRGTGAPHRPPALVGGLLLLAVVLVLLVWASLAVGSGSVGMADVVRGVFSPDPHNKGQLIVQEVRIPRTAAGLLAGVALGLAGTVMQGVARNPLADPGILGVNSGASAAVVLAMSVLGLSAPSQYIWFGFAGALVASVLVYGIGALGREGATPLKLALSGAATSAVLMSLTTAMLLGDDKTFDQYRFWQVGSLSGREAPVLWQALPFIVVGAVFALALGPKLNALSLGDDLARGLGQRVGPARLASAGAVVLLCGAATVVAGPIGFVGLVIPHAARIFTGPDYRWILPYSALLAPSLLLAADIVGRVIARPGEVQVGIVTAAIGAIPFIVLVRRRDMAEL